MDSYNNLNSLHFFLRLFALHNISSDKTGLTIDSWPYFKVTSILFIFGFLMSYNLYLHYSTAIMKSLSPSVVVVDTVDLVLSYCEYIVDLYYVYKYRREMYGYYNNYEQMDMVFNMKYHKKIKLSVKILLFICLPSWLLASVTQYAVWSASAGWLSPMTYAVSYFTFLVRILTALDFISHTIHVKLRLRSITERIQEFAAFAEDSTNRINVRRKWGNTTEIEDGKKVNPVISKCQSGVAKTNSYYLLLIEQTQFLNRFFGVRILGHCVYTLSEMITFVNFVARVISGTMDVVITSNVFLIPNIHRFVNSVAVLTGLVFYSESCHHECWGIVDIIDQTLVNKRISDESRSSLNNLRMLVTSRPLKLTAAGFFNLESTLLLSIASVVITYALILVQSTQ